MNNNTAFRPSKPLKRLSYRKYRYFSRFFKKISIWHVTYQLTDILPLEKTKILLTIHDLNFLREKDSEQIPFFKKILQDNIDRSSAIVTISNFVKNEIEEHCTLGGKEVHVIYNGCNIDDSATKKLDKEHSFHKRDYIYTISVITPKKNIHILPNLLVGNDLFLIISGFIQDQNYYDLINTKAKELGVSHRIIFTGGISEEQKYKYIRDCTLFVFPSRAEGFGLPVIEAMHFGKKVLLSLHTSLPEIGGKHAFYLEKEDDNYLQSFATTTLKDIIAQEVNEEEIINWAKQFSWDEAARKYESLYRQLI